MTQATGGCQCSRVRYTVQLDNAEASFCHCRMCQRATGGVAAAMVNVPRDAVVWKREPDRYASSPIAHRGFCSACGTPLTFEYDEGSDKLDLTVGSLDDPSLVRLQSHFGVESWVPGWLHHDDLPTMRSDEHQPLVERWAAVHKAE